MRGLRVDQGSHRQTDRERCGPRSGLCVNDKRSGTALKCGIRKIPLIRNEHDQKDGDKHAGEQQYLPSGYAPTLHALEGNSTEALCQRH
jgi:hypothetical protein